MRQGFLLLLFAQCLYLATPCAASLLFYTSEAEWLAATINVEAFDTTSEAVALSTEVSSPPGSNADLGSILTFEAQNTGLTRSFRVMSLNVPSNLSRGLVFEDTEAGLGGVRNISIGDADGTGDPATRSLYENDDWEIEILSGPPLTAFGFTLVKNDESISESLQVYSGTTLLGTMTDLATVGEDGFRFLGVVSTEAITRIVFDEDEFDPGPNYDDIAIRDFRFAERLPPTTSVEPATWDKIKLLFR